MKRRFYGYLFALCLGLTIPGCSDDNDRACNISTPTYLNINAGVVSYSANTTGSSTINSLTYLTPGGPVSVNNPVIPFVISVPVPAGSTISITVMGTARNGEITIAHAFAGANGEVDQDTVQCGN